MLLAAYVVLSLGLDPGGYLGTDTGAKVATLEVMDRSGSARPDVGYWAEEWDPQGVAHPLYQAYRTADGDWVAVTTLPMLQAARPLYAIGGYRLALVLPMVGGVATALAARALARRLGDDGTRAFWVIGLASPILVYSLDLWEHTWGVAAMVGAAVLVLDVVAGRGGAARAAGAGALLGAAATLRTEALAYALVIVGTGVLALLVSERAARRALLLGTGSLGGFALPWLANAWLERVVGGLSRAGRAGGTAGRVGSDVTERLREAMVTLVGVKGATGASVVIGVGVVLSIVVAARAEQRGDRRFAVTALVLAAIPYVAGAAADLAFVPGMLAAFPLALGAVLIRRAEIERLVVAMAVVALPLVWAFQYLGGAGPQWGGRYTLTSMVLLGTMATIGLRTRLPVVSAGLTALSLAIAASSVLWLGVRSRSVDTLFQDLRAIDADVLVARGAFLLREGGAATVGQRWLSVDSDVTYDVAIAAAEASGATRLAVLEYDADRLPDAAVPPGWTVVERDLLELTGRPVAVALLER